MNLFLAVFIAWSFCLGAHGMTAATPDQREREPAKQMPRRGIPYAVAPVPWTERIEDKDPRGRSTDHKPTAPNRLGKHRAVIRVTSAGQAAYLDLPWRRHDRDIGKQWFFMIHHQSWDTVKNIYRVEVTNERCRIVFGPVVEGTYYFYYLPYYILESPGAYGTGDPWEYSGAPPPPDERWVRENNVTGEDYSRYVQAECVEIQSKTAFDSFYPMEVIATAGEKDSLRALHKGKKFLVFPEDRKDPIRMLDNIPQKWILDPPGIVFTGSASKNEYYALQLGVWALDSLGDVKVEFQPLVGKGYRLPASAMTCFNTGGIDAYGNAFTKRVNVRPGNVQPLWIGLDLPRDIPGGTYRGRWTVRVANAESSEIEVLLTVTDHLLSDRGDGEPWRHSRLRWLNSTLGIDEKPVAPYLPISVTGNTLNLTGKTVTLVENGLPGSITVYGERLLQAPVQFTVEIGAGPVQWGTRTSKTVKLTENCYVQETSQRASSLELVTRTELESDGWMKCRFLIKALQEVDLADIRLTIPYRKEHSTLMSGMDLYGAATPENHDAKWDSLYDAFWLGNTRAGLYCELRGAAYSGPMLYWPAIRDFFKLKPPVSWNNDGQGGYRIRTTGSRRDVIVYSGPRVLERGKELTFECAFILTPVKPLDTQCQLANRYYHNSVHPEPGEAASGYGIQKINLHHGNYYNQYINYPFSSHRQMKDFVEKEHERGAKVKIYYTTRELTTMATEIWAFRSLGSEILLGGPGGGHAWLKEHFVQDYAYNWYILYGDERPADLAVQTSIGMNRFYNYYIEDLRWLATNVGMDGLYLDAAAYDRETVKRIKKAIAAVRPDCILDLHEGQNSILRYLEFFPYLDKIWFGEGVDYEGSSPATWLTSISGIPFGFIGDMLHKGGNPWRGLVYGMTARYGWESYGIFMDPRHIWKAMDDFGIAQSTMVGYWDDKPAVTTSNQDVPATAYVKDGKMLVSLASWAKVKTDVTLNIDVARAGLRPGKVIMTAPAIPGFQPARKFAVGEPIPADPGKGWLLIIQEQ